MCRIACLYHGIGDNHMFCSYKKYNLYQNLKRFIGNTKIIYLLYIHSHVSKSFTYFLNILNFGDTTF